MSNQWFVFPFLVLCSVVLLQGVTLIKFMNKSVSKSEQQPPVRVGKPNVDEIGLKLGEPFPLEILRSQNGERYAAGPGKAMLVLITSATCKTCEVLIRELHEFDLGPFVDVWVVHWGSPEEAMSAQAQMDRNIRVAATDYATLQTKLRSNIFPLAYFVNSQGIVERKDVAAGRYPLMALAGRAMQPQEAETA